VQLFIAGHPRFQKYRVKISLFDCDLAQLAKTEVFLLEELNKWNTTINSVRDEFYYLNFFTIHQLHAIVSLIDKQRNRQKLSPELADFLRFISLDQQVTDRRASVTLRPLEHVGDEEEISEQQQVKKLCMLGQQLGQLFQDARKTDFVISFAVPQVTRSDFTAGEPNLIVTSPERVLNQVLSLYAHECQRMPEAEEVLICSKETTHEHIKLLMLRCFGAEKAGRRSRLYCLAHVEQLPFELQNFITDLHADLAAQHQQHQTDESPASSYRLAAIAGHHQGHVITSWSSFRRKKIDLLPEVDLRQVIQQRFDKRGLQVHFFSSEFAGMGKTYRAHSWCLEKAQRLPQTVQLQGHAVREGLSDYLRHAAAPVVLHLDLSPDVDSRLNTLLFQLLVTGALQLPDGQLLYWPEPSTLAIEMPNSTKNSTKTRLHFLGLLSGTVLQKENDNPLVTKSPKTQNEAALMPPAVLFHPAGGKMQNKVQYVCKFLQAFRNDILASTEIKPDQIPDLSYGELRSQKGCGLYLWKPTVFLAQVFGTIDHVLSKRERSHAGAFDQLRKLFFLPVKSFRGESFLQHRSYAA